MVKETLKQALESAVRYYNSGLSANDAIVKAASEHDLTADQTDRVVESFNTAKTISYFDKNASDRTGTFDLASKKEVTLALFGAGKTEKKASAEPLHPENPDALSDAFYFGAPDTTGNRKQAFVQKRATLLDFLAKQAEEKWAHGYSDSTIQGFAKDALDQIKAASADADSGIRIIDNYLLEATVKIAESITHAPYGTQNDIADLFKVACPHEMVINEVSKRCPILKAATGGQYVRTPVVDTAPVDDLLKEADDIMDAVKERTELRQKKAMFDGKVKEVREAILRDPSLAEKVAANSTLESFIRRPTKTAAVKQEKIEKEAVEKAALTMEDAVDALSPALVVKSRKEENEALRDEARGALLADLLSSDPILQDADPRQVSEVYKSIVASSPRVSLNKEVVRSVLRGAVNSIALSPNDMKVLTDVDKGINQAYGLSNLDSSVKDSVS